MSKYKASRPLKKVVPDSVISEAIISLHKAEKDTNQNNTGASTKPESYKLEANEKNLDSLAALLTGEETCAAVCHDGNNLLIASNESGPKYAKQYLPLLKKYIDSPFKKNYQLLEQEANEQIKNIIKDLNVSGKLDQGLKKAKAHKDTNYEWLAKSIILRDLESIKRVGEIIIQDSSSHQQTRELAIEVLRPLIDTRIIANTLETSQGLDSKVILAIKNDHIKYLTSSSYKHAEMKIFDELLDNNKVGLYYIGITKLTCWPCDASLILFNKAGYELRIIFGGTHGGTYPSWEAPNWIISDVKIKQQFVDYVTKEAGKYFKEKEAHPYFDEFIPPEPILAQYNDQEEVLANFKHLENLISEHQKKCYDIQQEIKMRSEEKQAKMTLRNSSDIQDRSQTNDPTSKKQKIEHQLKSVTENIHQRQLSLTQANLTKSIFDQILNKQYASDTKKWEAMRDFLNEDKIFGKKVVSEIRDDKKLKNAIDKITSASQKYYTHLDTQCNQDTVKQLTDKIAELNREQIELNAIVNQQRENTGDFKLEIGNLEQQVSERQLQLKRVKQDINPTMRKYLILKNILKKCLSYSDEENKNNLDVTCNDQDEDNETELDQVAHIVSFNNPYQIANDIHVLDNGANKATEDSYQYQCSDIRYIGKQLFGSMTGNIHWLGDIGEGHEDLEASNLLPSNIEKPVVGVYNIENFHWVAFAVKKIDSDFLVFYKDSLNDKNIDESFKELIQKKYSKQGDISFCSHSPSEQTEAIKTSCGVFALKNALVIAKKLLDGELGIDEDTYVEQFDKINFVTQDEIPSLRTSYGNLYALECSEQLQNLYKANITKRIVKDSHEADIQKLIDLIQNKLKETEFNDVKFIIIKASDMFDNYKTQDRTIGVEIYLADQDLLSLTNYQHFVQIHFSEDINQKELLLCLDGLNIQDIPLSGLKGIIYEPTQEKEEFLSQTKFDSEQYFLEEKTQKELETELQKMLGQSFNINDPKVEQSTMVTQIPKQKEAQSMNDEAAKEVLAKTLEEFLKKWKEEIKAKEQIKGIAKEGLSPESIKVNLDSIVDSNLNNYDFYIAPKIITQLELLSNLNDWQAIPFLNYGVLIKVENETRNKHAVLLHVSKEKNGLVITITDPLSEKDSTFKSEIEILAQSLDQKGAIVKIVYSGKQDKDYGTCADMSLIMLQELIEQNVNKSILNTTHQKMIDNNLTLSSVTYENDAFYNGDYDNHQREVAGDVSS